MNDAKNEDAGAGSLATAIEELERRNYGSENRLVTDDQISPVVDVEGPAGLVPRVYLDSGDSFEEYDVTDPAHHQIAAALDIPAPFYFRLVDQAPELWASTVTYLLRSTAEARLLRLRNPRKGPAVLRAFLPPDALVVLDLHVLSEAMIAIARAVSDAGRLVVDVDVREECLEVKVVTRGSIHVLGREFLRGVYISHSELGGQKTHVRSFLVDADSGFGLIAPHNTFRHSDDSTADEGVRREAFFRHFATAIIEALGGGSGFDFSASAHVANDVEIFAKPHQIIANLVRTYSLSPEVGTRLLAKVQSDRARAARWTQFGVVVAIMSAAQDSETFHEAAELQKLAGRLLVKDAKSFRRIVRRKVTEKEYARAFA